LQEAIGAASAYPGPAIIEFRVARNEDVYPWVLGGTSLGEVLADTPYAGVGGQGSGARDRTLASAGPSPKDASDR